MVGKIMTVALGGAMGATCRYLVSLGMSRWLGPPFPWGTFTVNLLGSFVMGLLFALARELVITNETTKLLLMVGFLGSFTTFSSFALDNVQLMKNSSLGWALLNIGVQNVMGLALVLLGFGVVQWFR